MSDSAYSRETFEAEIRLLEESGIKGSELRQRYERKVAELSNLAGELAEQGLSEEQIARTLHERRRTLGAEYKLAAPPIFREYIYYATAKKYGDPLGPTYDELARYKSNRQIIESASRPIEDLNARLTLEGFRRWFDTVEAHSSKPDCS